MAGLNVTSEIGKLKRVLVHSPGPEVEAMTPKEAEADLYNDIIPLSAMRSEFDVLKSFLLKSARSTSSRRLSPMRWRTQGTAMSSSTGSPSFARSEAAWRS